MVWTDERIATERLTLRAFSTADTDVVATLLTDEVIRRYLGGPVELPTGFSAAMVAGQWGSWCVGSGDTDEAIGSITLHRERGQLELSYSLIPEAWGKGIAHEACRAIIEWVWASTEEPVLIAVTQTANEPSIRLLDRLGFAEDSRFTEHDAEQSLQVLHRG